MAESSQQHSRQLLYYASLWLALGLQLSWKKAARGRCLCWIGFKLSLVGSHGTDLQVELADNKKEKLLATFKELEDCKGLIPLHLLQYAVGVLGWLS